MPVPIGDVLGILADNVEQRHGVLPLSGRQSSGWARGLGIPVGGKTILYTGQMYQLVPAISSMSAQLARFEDTPITHFFGVGRTVNKVVNLSAFMAHANPQEQQTSATILRHIALLLQTAGVEFGYLYERELYSGALLYDEGVDGVFASQARKVYRLLKDAGAQQIITVDPHTTNMLRSVYPRVVDGYDLEVKTYLEVLAERHLTPARPLDLDVVIHDSCLYARSEGVIDQPRQLLRQSGVRVAEPELSGRLTQCCGGPLESLFPAKAHALAEKRVEQLTRCGNCIVTLCPICMVSLQRAAAPGVTVKDISEYLMALVGDK